MSLVTNLGRWEGAVQEDRRSAVTDGPVRGAQLPPSLGRQWFLRPEEALIPALWPGTSDWDQALLYTRHSAANAEPGFEIEKPTESTLSAALFPSDGGFLVAAANLSHRLYQRGAAPEPGDLSPALPLEAAAEDGGWGACSAGWCCLKRAELGHAGLSQGPREA